MCKVELRDPLQKGEFNNLPGAGKSLKLNDDPNTPVELLMVYKILKENDLSPDWIAGGKDFDVTRDQLIADMRAGRGATTARSTMRRVPINRNRRESKWKRVENNAGVTARSGEGAQPDGAQLQPQSAARGDAQTDV